MSDKEKVMERIRKLLALATDDGATENEAAIAMKRARKLMDEHQIKQIDIENMADARSKLKGEKQDFGDSWKKRPPKWLSTLCVAVADFNECIVKLEMEPTKDFKCVIRYYGLEGDAVSSALMLEYLKQNCAKRFKQFADAQGLKGKERNVATRDFRQAYSHTICGKIREIVKERKQSQLSNSKELMIIKNQLVTEIWGKANYSKSKHTVRGTLAENAGTISGQRAHLGRNVGGSSTKRIG